ncbi:MAG: Gfo/Idh/MocA family oxidoreductase, partial [Trueperaceae bacterium]|nr:Gfo/Idh/MocA family oxidoreductase [Trueperaceae bacterium]
MKLAIVGCGFIAERYATDLRHYSGLSLVAATDLDEDRSRTLVDRHGGTAYPDLATLLHDSDAELVINLTVHAAHAEVTRTCLGAGRHVFSEKPLALDADEADELVALADRKGLTLGCAPGNLLGDAQQLVGHYLQSGRLGTVRMVYAECNLGRVTQWSSNPEAFLRAGPLFDGAVYPLTLLVGYFGPVIAVEAAHSALLLSEHDHPATGTRFSVDTPDQVTALLRHENGTLVRLSASMYVPAQTKHFYSVEFHGDAGSLYLANSGDTGPFGPHAVEFSRVGKGYLSVPLPKPSEPRGYGAAIRETVAAIGAGRPVGVGGARAAHLVTIIDRIDRCATTHRPQPIDPPDLAQPTFAFPRVPTRLPPLGFGCSR